MIGILHLFAGSRVSIKMGRMRAQLADNAAVSAAFASASSHGRPLSLFGLKLLAQSLGVRIRYRFELVSLLNTLDIDRDGAVSEGDLIYWLGSQDEPDDAGEVAEEIEAATEAAPDVAAEAAEAAETGAVATGAVATGAVAAGAVAT